MMTGEQISAEDFYIGMVHPDPIDPGEPDGKIYRIYVSYPYLTNWVTERRQPLYYPGPIGERTVLKYRASLHASPEVTTSRWNKESTLWLVR